MTQHFHHEPNCRLTCSNGASIHWYSPCHKAAELQARHILTEGLFACTPLNQVGMFYTAPSGVRWILLLPEYKWQAKPDELVGPVAPIPDDDIPF